MLNSPLQLQEHFSPIDSHRLHVFCTVAETGSIAHAAKLLCLTRTALSHSLKTLEADLGCVLFERKERSISISECGKKLLPQARLILLEMSRVRATLSE